MAMSKTGSTRDCDPEWIRSCLLLLATRLKLYRGIHSSLPPSPTAALAHTSSDIWSVVILTVLFFHAPETSIRVENYAQSFMWVLPDHLLQLQPATKGPKNQGLPLVHLFSQSVFLISISMTLMISFSLLKISFTPVIRRLLVLIQHLISSISVLWGLKQATWRDVLSSLIKWWVTLIKC